MLNEKLRWLYYGQNINDEVLQCKTEGKDITPYLEEIDIINKMPPGKEKEALAFALIKKLNELPVADGFPYDEPEEYSEIIRSLDDGFLETYDYDAANFRERLYGAWAGRAIGCLLGIPVETWERKKIIDFLKETDNYPLNRYLSSKAADDVKLKYGISDRDEATPYDRQKTVWIDHVDEFPVDDDTNYTVCALKLVERFGIDFTPEDVAETWLFGFPALHACTAERIAYRNLLNCILPPLSAKHLNPFREWIGAQIRADFFGYISPGNPRLAASMAYRDASVSHVKNGVYGAMYIAALNSLAPCGRDSLWMAETALKQIPPSSRLHVNIKKICEMYTAGKDYGQIIDFIHEEYNEKSWFDWCHTIPNAMIVTASLLINYKSFDSAITNTVMNGFDTDCNGASVGSVAGMMLGKSAIDGKWLDHIRPTVNSSIHGYYSLSLDELVERTYKLVAGER